MATIAYNGIIYGNDTVELTKAEYDALGDKVLTDGITYFITDIDVAGGGSASGCNAVDITEADYIKLLDDGLVEADTTYYITDSKDENDASFVKYDNIESGLEATNVQEAIDELNSKLYMCDNNLDILSENIDNLSEGSNALSKKIVDIENKLKGSATSQNGSLTVSVPANNLAVEYTISFNETFNTIPTIITSSNSSYIGVTVLTVTKGGFKIRCSQGLSAAISGTVTWNATADIVA